MGESMSAGNKLIDNTFVKQDTLLSGAKTTSEEVSDFPSERGQLLRALEHLESLDVDWEGNDAESPDSASLRTAQFFIESIPAPVAYPDIISPGMEGSIVLKWSQGFPDHLLMTIDGPLMYLSVENEGGYEDLASEKFLGIIPERIKEKLPKENA